MWIRTCFFISLPKASCPDVIVVYCWMKKKTNYLSCCQDLWWICDLFSVYPIPRTVTAGYRHQWWPLWPWKEEASIGDGWMDVLLLLLFICLVMRNVFQLEGRRRNYDELSFGMNNGKLTELSALSSHVGTPKCFTLQ